MILIDKEKFIEEVRKRKYSTASIRLINEQPEVKAIPIEWLHSIMERQVIFAMESEMEGTTTVKDGVIHCVSGALACQVLANVIELWEKENE